MHRGPEDAVQKDVSVAPVLFVEARHLLVEHELAGQPRARRRRRAQAGVIRLDAAHRDERVAPARAGVAEQELELAQLVAAAAQPHEVVALGEEAHPAQLGAEDLLQPVQPLDRRRPADQVQPRHPPERFDLPRLHGGGFVGSPIVSGRGWGAFVMPVVTKT